MVKRCKKAVAVVRLMEVGLVVVGRRMEVGVVVELKWCCRAMAMCVRGEG